jgi:hypothetical protein
VTPRVSVRQIAGIDTREGTTEQNNIRMTTSAGVPSGSAASTLGPALFQRLGHDLNHGFVLKRRVDSSQPVGPQLVAIGQQDLEQTESGSNLTPAEKIDQLRAGLHATGLLQSGLSPDIEIIGPAS